LKVHGQTRKSLLKACIWLGNFDVHLREAGLGQISKVFGAKPPHASGVCVAEAWSIAELLWAAKEDVSAEPARLASAAPRFMRSQSLASGRP
jgi:glycogen debranching enzyme